MVVWAALFLAGCGGGHADSSVHETVLSPGEQITATNRFGTVRITYIAPTKRMYEWENWHETRTLWMRTERWYGCLGLYDPAPAFLIEPKVRLVLQEGIRNFRTASQLAAKLREASAVEDWVYDNSGLVVGFGRTPERGNQVNVDLFQYLINGKKPSTIPGARPSAIRRQTVDSGLKNRYILSEGVKPQDEIPPLINDPFDSHGTE